MHFILRGGKKMVKTESHKQAVFELLKIKVEREMEGKSFNLNLITKEKEVWHRLQATLKEYAQILLGELNRFQKTFVSFEIDEIMRDYKEENTKYFFDFFSRNASVRFVFNKEANGYIYFSHIEEEIFEDPFALL